MSMGKVLLHFAASVIILAVMLQQWVGISSIWLTMLTIDPLYFLLIIAIPFIVLYVYSYRWKLLLESVGLKVSQNDAFRYALIGMLFDNLTPMSRFGGEPVKGYMLADAKNFPKKRVFASIAVDTVITLISIIGLLYFSTIGLATYGIMDTPTVFLIIASAVIPTMLTAYFVYNRSLFISVTGAMSKAIGKIQSKSAGNIEKEALKFREMIKMSVKRKDILAKSLMISAAERLLEIAGLYVIFAALGYPISLQSCAIVTSVGIIAGNVPFLPGGLVLFESSSILALGALGVPVLTGTTAILILRFSNYWLMTFVGLLVSWGGGINLSERKHKAFKFGL
ncbi:MAG: lysylphosphatidylglycerol synthase transmembrane domain-containing protein [Candidatus Aenigmatarchaeota archaeon]